MTERFDLFQVDNEGVLWVGTANSLEECRSLAKNVSQDCDYRVVDQTTGETIELPRTGLRGAQEGRQSKVKSCAACRRWPRRKCRQSARYQRLGGERRRFRLW